MDQFEAARLKSAKRQAYYESKKAPVFQEESSESLEPETMEIPKEKPKAVKKDGKFTVLVEMPHATFTFVITKQSILSHAPSNRLSQSEIRRHIIEGLKPLLGGLE